MQRMEPPPPLAPICDAPIETMPSGSVPTADDPPAHPTPAAGLTRLHTQILSVYQDFLAQQSRTHDIYLRLSTELREHMLPGHDTRSVPSDPIPDAPPVQTPNGPAAHTPSPPPDNAPVSPVLDRAQLEQFASENVAPVLGDKFAALDRYPRRTRLPQPPLLLIDRVLRLDGQAGSMGPGTIVTETDISQDDWYLHHGRMPPSLFFETCQVNLLLMVWLGADFLHRGELFARLLGFEVTFHGPLPTSGEVLLNEVHVSGHAQQDDILLFFGHATCHIDGKLRLSGRNVQLGLFTADILKASKGLQWHAAEAIYTERPHLAPAVVACPKSAFTLSDLHAYLDGDLVTCFGQAYAWAQSHTRTPTFSDRSLQLIEEVTHYKPNGGSAQWGYLRAKRHVDADDWFFAVHFKDDPCMPGNLMVEGCWQAMAFYLTAMGFTLQKDGWRFEPVPDVPYTFRFRGDVTPTARELIYEVFVDDVIAEPYPTLYAHVLCQVDGKNAFLCERLGIRLVPDWPLTSMPTLLNHVQDRQPVACIGDLRLDQQSILHCALGTFKYAFGEAFRIEDHRRVPRLPAPPYQFITRIVEVDAIPLTPKAGSWVKATYDIPEDAWYFQDNGFPTMPYCVLVEVGLQVCGWLAGFTGDCLIEGQDLYFRNLDGKAIQHREVHPTDGTLMTEITLISTSRAHGVILERFEIKIECQDARVLTMEAVFGFFPHEAMAQQKGFPVTPQDRERIDRDDSFSVPLDAFNPPETSGDQPSLARSSLRMIDQITGFWPEDGAYQRGRIRGEKKVQAGDWFFKAHFFQDPVQPGSLGLEAMIQLLQWHLLHHRRHEGLRQPYFEPILIGQEMEWHYRGQVTPANLRVVVDIEIREEGRDAQGYYVLAEGHLWVDDLQIYHVPMIGVRLVSEDQEHDTSLQQDWTLRIAEHPWIADHRPTYTIPTLPLTFALDMMAQGATSLFPMQYLIRIDHAEILRWMPFYTDALDGRTCITPHDGHRAAADLQLPHDVDGQRQFERAAHATFEFASTEPATKPLPALPELISPQEMGDPYRAGHIFHGPMLQLVQHWVIGHNGARCRVRMNSSNVPRGAIHPGALDAALHTIPHDELQLWCSDIPEAMISYPLRIESLSIHQAFPESGEVEVELRFIRLEANRFPVIEVWIHRQHQLIVSFTFVGMLLPEGAFGGTSRLDRKAFLLDRAFVKNLALTQLGPTQSVLNIQDVKNSEWLPGNLSHVFGVKGTPTELAPHIAMVEHTAQYLRIHPSKVVITDDQRQCANLPFNPFHLDVTIDSQRVLVQSSEPGMLDWEPGRRLGIQKTGGQHNCLHDLLASLNKRFIRYVILEDPDDFQTLTRRPVLYLANHQVGVESLLFMSLMDVLTTSSTQVIAKQEHQHSWLGTLHRLAQAYFKRDLIQFFDRQNPQHLFAFLHQFQAEREGSPMSLLIHVEGTRALHAGQPIQQVSSVLLDLAIQRQLPIVPVRFVGGLPTSGNTERLNFPVAFGQQDYYLGRAIRPQELQDLPYRERTEVVVQRLNRVGPRLQDEKPLPAPDDMPQQVEALAQDLQVSPLQATLIASLQQLHPICAETQTLLDRLVTGRNHTQVLQKDSLLYGIHQLLSGHH